MKWLLFVMSLLINLTISEARDINELRFSNLEAQFNNSQPIASAKKISGQWYARTGSEKIVFSTGRSDMLSSWEAVDPYENALRGADTLNIEAQSNKEIKVVDYKQKEDIERYNFDENIFDGSLFFKGYSSSYSEASEETVTWDLQTECRALGNKNKLICSMKSTNHSTGGYRLVYTIYVR